MHVAELWRFPVKSLRGERLERADVRELGVPGDRSLHVVDAAGALVTGRTRPALLGLSATLGENGEPEIDGRPWRDAAVTAVVAQAAGEGARLHQFPRAAPRFDDSPLLVATDGAIADLGVDGRRLRPNVVVGGVEGLAEREWPGRHLRAGDVLIQINYLCERCVMTTIDPDTLEVDPDVLRRINETYDKRFALNCSVAEPGTVAVGDPVELV